ncbi:TIGR03086 family metal-binding protein [Nocardioides sp. LHG3406-4]|uniref:TIGR03086 family metal-binding protein n=1 Tax=Nocardioides sp. LHG3406-4 TaxID=2804575 RepID=UPI003CEA5245
MTTATEAVIVLSRALDQTGDVLAAVHADQLSKPTPCTDWDVAHLIGHVTGAPGRFLEMLQGEQPDWSTGPEPATEGWAARFRAAADDLIHYWHQQGDAADAGQVDWQIAELAVHSWDLATATGQDVDRLDPEVAERGLAFMSASLTDDNRGGVFGAPAAVPDDASVYDRLAAWAGRTPAWSA